MSAAVSSFWTGADTDGAAGLPGGRISTSHVTAVLVSHNGAKWLPRVLDSLRDSDRRPEAVIAVDTGSHDGSQEILAADRLVDEVVVADTRTGFGAAVRLGLAEAPSVDEGSTPSPTAVVDLTDESSGAAVDLRDRPADEGLSAQTSEPSAATEWVWLLHDDCAVAPDALEQLLACADVHPDASVVGPKVRRWRRRSVLLECGVSYTRSGRKITGIEGRELDQGQYDGRLDVMAVGSAGMLVRRDVWDRLSGYADSLPIFGDDQDFCYRVQRSGGRVLVATKAVVFHREAATVQRREIDAGPHSALRARRRAANLNVLAHVPLWRLPFTMVRLLLSGVLGWFLALLGLTAGSAWDQFASAVGPVVSLRALWRVRRLSARSAQVSRRQVRHRNDLVGRNGSYWQEAVPRFLDHGSQSSMKSIRRRGRVLGHWLGAVLLPTLLVSFVAMRSLWFGVGQIQGGALLPAPEGVAQLWGSFLSSWHEVGMGSDVAAPPFLAVLSGLSLVFAGSATAAVQVLLLLAPVFAATTAFFAMRGLASGLPRIAGAVAYGMIPAAVAAVGTGRLATAVVAIALPFTLRGIARVSGVAGDRLPPRSVPLIAGVALGVAIVGAFSPPLALIQLALGLIWALSSPRRPRNVMSILGVTLGPIALLWPWSGYLLANPGLLLLDTGAQSNVLSTDPAAPWQLAMLDPGGPAAPPTGLGVILLVVALVATLNRRTRRLAVIAWSAVLAGLALAVWQSLFPTEVPWASEGQLAWPGSATVLIGAGFVALLVAASAYPSATRRKPAEADEEIDSPEPERDIEFRRSPGVIGPSLALASALVVGGWWALDQQPILERTDPTVVSPFVATTATGPEAPRTLLLSGVGRGLYEYQLVSGSGPVLGDAEVAPDVASLARIDDAVARLAAGASGADVDTLAEAAVRYVQIETRGNRELSRRLDAVAGLSRTSTVDGRALWEVEGWQPRARIAQSDGATVSVPVEVEDSGAVSITTQTPQVTDGRRLVLAEAPSPLWAATAGDSVLAAEADQNMQTFAWAEGTAASAPLTAATDQNARLLSLAVPAGALGLIALVGVVRAFRRRRPPSVVDVRSDPRSDAVATDDGASASSRGTTAKDEEVTA